MTDAKKKRLDVFLVENGHAQSRERAQSLIAAGKVNLNGKPAKKAGASVEAGDSVELLEPDHPYVSRGALKLVGALDAFDVSVEGKTALDIGASTGGFTQVLLERGIRQVVAVDVGSDQMDKRVKSDPRVVCIEKTNARNLNLETIRQKVDVVVVDVSFISLDKIFPPLSALVAPSGDVITLIKPQFEVGREEVGNSGLVQSDAARKKSVDRITDFAKTLGWKRIQLIESPITGTDGNIEYLAHWRREN